MKRTLQALAFLFIFISGVQAQNQYKTIAAGNWNVAGTWSSVAPYDGIPPSTIPNNVVVEIGHRVIYNLADNLIINGSVFIRYDTLRFLAAGRSIEISNTGYLEVLNGGLIMPRGGSNSGNIKNFGHTVCVGSYVEVPQNWESENGRRKFVNSCLKAGENYINKNSIDTVVGVCIELGTANTSGSFENDGGTIEFSTATILLKGTSGSFKNKSASSQILTHLSPPYAIHALYVPNGDLENVGTWVATVNKYCVSGNITGSNAGEIDFTSPEDCGFFVVNNSCTDCSPQNSPLPVEFKSFTATRSGSNVLLNWKTQPSGK